MSAITHGRDFGRVIAALLLLPLPGFSVAGRFQISRLYDQNIALRFNAEGKDARTVYLEPAWLAPTSDDGVYAWLPAFRRIVRIGRDSVVRTAAGGGDLDPADGVPALRVKLPESVYGAAAPSGELYFTAARRIFRIESSGSLKLVAGNGEPGFGGDGGPATAAAIDSPYFPVFDPQGVLYFYSSYRIRSVDAQGTIRTLAGNGEYGFAEGPAHSVPVVVYGMSLGADAAGNVYWMCGGYFVKLDRAAATVSVIAASTFVGSQPRDGLDARQLGSLTVSGIAATPSGDLCMADRRYRQLFCVTPAGKVRMLAGNGNFGWQSEGSALDSPLIRPDRIAAAADGTIWFLDHTAIRKIEKNALQWRGGVFAGSGLGEDGPLTAALLHDLQGVAWNRAGELHFSETATHTVWKIDSQDRLRRVAGNGMPAVAGDGGPARLASLLEPYGICFDASDNLYITSPGRLRKVDRSGSITTVATGSAAESMGSTHCAVDRDGVVYFTLSSRSSVIYRLDSSGARIFAGTPMKWGFGGDNGSAAQALLDGPRGIAVDSRGNVYFADYNNSRIRKITPAGVITSVAGNGSKGAAGDGGPALQAQFGSVHDVAADAKDNLYVVDSGNGRIRRIDPSGLISVVAGGGAAFQEDAEATSVLLSTVERLYDFCYYLEAGPNGRLAGIDDGGIFALDSARIFPNWVYNAASFQSGAVAPGEIVTFYGDVIGPNQLLTAGYSDGKLPGELGRTRVLFDGVAAPLVYVSEGQSSVLVPYGVGATTKLVVEFEGERTNSIELSVAAAAPGIFTYAGGTGQIVAVNLNPDGSTALNDPAHPARRGGWLTFFLTGQGRVTPGVADGRQLNAPDFPVPQLPVTVTIGSISMAGSNVWAGLVYQGVLQVNVRIPEDAQPGDDVPILVRIGEVSSPGGTTVAVR